MLYDTHCHPYLAKKKSQDTILENFFSNGGKYLNCIAVDLKTSQTSIDLAQKYSGIFASIGIHPTYTQEQTDTVESFIETLETIYKQHSQYIVAIGEAGLDYYWLEKLSETHNIPQQELKNIQKRYFRAQIQLSKKLKLPLVIHNREAKNDVLQILIEEKFQNFVFHCYSEDYDFAQKLIEYAPDCKLGFGGVCTFKNSLSVQETVKNIPLENIIIETDSPYLTPTPYRGKEENEPLYTQYVLSTIIDLRKEKSEEIQKQIFENSIDFFKIKA